MKKTSSKLLYSVKEMTKNIWLQYKIPVLSTGLTLFMILQWMFIRPRTMHSDRWVRLGQIRNDVQSSHQIIFWIMVVVSAFFSYKYLTDSDKIYEKIKKIPIDIFVIITFVSFIIFNDWTWTVNENILYFSRVINLRNPFHIRNFQVLFMIGLAVFSLSLLGYFIQRSKDLFSVGLKVFINNTFLYSVIIKNILSFIANTLSSSIGKKFVVRLALFTAFSYFLIIFFILQDVNDGTQFRILIIYPLYLIITNLVIIKVTSNKRNHFIKLTDLVDRVKSGEFDEGVQPFMGYYEDLKNKIITIETGFSEAVTRAITSERMKSDLITNVSHDLKTPLTSIITYIDLLQQEDLAEEKRVQFLKTLEQKSERLRVLIDDLFEVSRASSGALVLEYSEVDVSTLMKQTIEGVSDRILESNLQLKTTFPETPAIIMADGARLHRVFENLIINILKYSLPLTRAYINICMKNEDVVIIFRNISEHEINIDNNELTERFVRAEVSRTTEGSGLGLAIAKNFTEIMGGNLLITTDGDLFKVTITFNINSLV